MKTSAKIVDIENNSIRAACVFQHREFLISVSSVMSQHDECDSIGVMLDDSCFLNFTSVVDAVHYVDDVYERLETILNEKSKYIVDNLIDNGLDVGVMTHRMIEKNARLFLLRGFLLIDYMENISKNFVDKCVEDGLDVGAVMHRRMEQLIDEIIDNYLDSIA